MTKMATPRRDESPLRTFDSVEKNLQRERRVFSIVVALLALCTLACAAVAIAVRLNASLRAQEQLARLYEQSVVDAVLERRSALTASNLILGLRANDPFHPDSGDHANSVCVRVSRSSREDAVLQQSCDEAVRILLAAGQMPAIEMISVADRAAYRYVTAYSARTRDVPKYSSAQTSMIVDAVLNQYRTERIDPLEAAREKRVAWLTMPSGQTRDRPEMIGASLISKGNRIYAVVLTRIALKDLFQPAREGLSVPDAILFDRFNVPLASSGDEVNAGFLERKLQGREDGVFHWIPGCGWALRLTPLTADFGRLVFVLPPGQQLQKMAGELQLIGAVTAVVLALLFAMYRHWNYRFLAMTYEEASRALESEMLNHLLVHANPVGLCIVRRETLEIIVSNQIAREVLGISPGETRLPHGLRAVFDAHLGAHTSSASESGIFQIPFALKLADGNQVHLEITYAPAEVRQEPVLFCAIVDMTEHHHSKQLLRQAKLASDAAAKAKLAFFASMSHELRTPLSSLVGNIELLALGQLDAGQRERVRAMQVSSDGLLQVVNDVLDFSKIDVGALSIEETPGSLVDLLHGIAAAHAREASKRGLTLHAVLDRRIPAELHFDAVRVSQIINNLLNNALKFTHTGKVVLRARWSNDGLTTEISDTGVGIPEDQRDRLFQPFSQATAHRLGNAPSTGLGLSICSKLCELMGGGIKLDSMTGVGTRVTVNLPLRASDGGSDVASPASPPAPRTAILFRAPEHYETLLNHLDWPGSPPAAIRNTCEPLDSDAFECLVVTEEFSPEDVARWWPAPASIVWVKQQGPLVASILPGGGQEVSIYSRAGFQTALLGAVSGDPSPQPFIDARVDQTSEKPLQGLRVLIAEDNVLNRSLLRDQLCVLGASVLQASNGCEALRTVSNSRVDVVLTDIDMPDMNGFELLRELDTLALDIPVYAISASTRQADVSDARAMGFANYLTKPVSLAVLASIRSGTDSREKALHRNENPATQAALSESEIPDIPRVPSAYASAFLEQAESDLETLERVIAGRNVPQLERTLHRTSGTLAVLERSALLALCEELHHYLAEVGGWNAEIESQAAFVVQELARMCKRVRRSDMDSRSTGTI
ncbi:hybrid sensor histidine kinase/response regulator [Paraburkholderia acidiphila]|uniref:histidine kinase n=1 Tax=Paraburkholderia acidiphila TaxID=2571747 RepID=A0A7Z2GE03_9BURK|nr:hybrid sensor histidine kinase/response regulator [Paraburkholderia acidiphila]QGZ60048.1 response regulator [Paraburkholderia acidiphila]